MLWLYIILGIVLFFLIILLMPIGLKASYTEDFSLVLCIGFVKIRLYPAKPKKPKKSKKKQSEKKPEKPKEKKPSLIKEKGLSWLVDLLKKLCELAKGVLKDFFKHIIIKRMMVSISVAGKDAADTAVMYGYYCSAVYPCVGIIAKSTKCKNYGVDISPNFEENAKSSYSLDFEAKILLLWIAALIIKHGIKALKLLLELKEN